MPCLRAVLSARRSRRTCLWVLLAVAAVFVVGHGEPRSDASPLNNLRSIGSLPVDFLCLFQLVFCNFLSSAPIPVLKIHSRRSVPTDLASFRFGGVGLGEEHGDEALVAAPPCYVLDGRRPAGLWSAEAFVRCCPTVMDASRRFADCRHRQLPFSGAFVTCPCWNLLRWCGCAVFSLLDGVQDEVAVFKPFGTSRRWMTKPLLRFLRFNGGDPRSLSSVMQPQYLQLNSSLPLVQTPERPPEEPPAGHQLVCSTVEALEDWRCSIFEFELSSDKRWLFGSICNLPRLLHEWTSFLFVLPCTYVSSFVLCIRDCKSLSCIRYYV